MSASDDGGPTDTESTATENVVAFPGASRGEPGPGEGLPNDPALFDDPPAPAGGIVGVNVLQLARLDRNDLGNGQRFAARAQNKLIFVDPDWLGWDGKMWSAENGEMMAKRHAQATSAAIFGEAAAMEARAALFKAKPDKKDQAEQVQKLVGPLRKWAVDSGMVGKLEAMRAIAATHLQVNRDLLDPDPLALNLQNGVLTHARGADGASDVLDFTLEPHDPARRMTRVAACAYEPKARAPKWEAHLKKVLPDEEVREYFQACIGYALTGETKVQAIFMLHGKGGDGKSTTMNVIRRALGGYAVAADVKTFLEGAQKGGGDASPDLARLAGDIRLVSVGEPVRGAALNEGLIKTVTGGAPLLARPLHREPIEYRPSWKVFMEFNPRPRIKGDDDGIWRRIRVIPFPVQLKGAQIEGYEEELFAERDGVLLWALAGLEIYRTRGLREPEAVRTAIDDYRRGANPFGDWWVECIIEDADAEEIAGDLFRSYTDWCEVNAVKAMNNTAFGRALGDRQVVRSGKDARGKIKRRGAKLAVPVESSITSKLKPTSAEGGKRVRGKYDPIDPDEERDE